MTGQKELVLDWLRKHGSLTQATAFMELGVGRLSERIRELEKDGHVIEHKMVTVTKRNGKQARVCEYSLSEYSFESTPLSPSTK